MSAVLELLLSFRYTLIIFLCLEVRFISGQSNKLPEEEKNALFEIADQLGKKDWDFNLNPCDGNSNWTTKRADMPWYNNSVICDCSYPDGACHVQKIFLKGQDLAGVLPRSLAKLPYLNTIDLTRNYLSGTIPPEWASTKLEYLGVIVNRLSGPIPKYLGNITTLVYMSLENNQFNGTVPAELGKLINLENLILSDNNLTGKLPKELNNLKNLTELRLSSNRFSGKIPSFLSWTQLKKLEMQASGFEGPIHSSISVLKNLNELRISDLNGGSSKFPLLINMTGMNKLMLRSCNLSGEIPGYLQNMPALKTLDLSFNSLTGEIPDLGRLDLLQNTYLTQNYLTGSVPEWMKNRDTRYQFDLSYNNFTETSVPSTCRETLNLFKGYKEGKILELDKCLRSSPCSKDWYSFHVNCGGGGIKIGDTFFEGDEESSGPAKFVHSRENWGASNTGDFWGRNSSISDYVANNISTLRVNDSGLYMTARLSPIALTYYGRCLANGNYTVKLHFAEIVFRDNRSFQSLGRRMFDVYIQGEQKLKDFDIEKEANGVDKTVIQTFKTTVTDKTLEIRFHYAGKGSTAVPNRGTYGPMISAISVKSDFNPPSNERKKILIGTGATLLALFLILTVICFFWWKHRSNKISREQELRGLDLRTGFFTYRQIKAATNNFNSENNITCLETSEVAEKIDELLEKKGKGEFKSSGMNDVLTTALGSQEHYGRVRGVGGFVKPQVYFKTPRKKRETISRAVIENFKAQSEETKSLKAELEMLRSQLAAVIPLINDRSSETVASNKFSGMKDQKLSDDHVEELYDCGTSNTKGKKCHLAVKERENVVAYGTIISEGGPNVMIHHVPLGEENFKVSIDVVLNEKAELPIPIKFGPTIINDAVGVIVGWPKELVIFPTIKRKGKPQSFALVDVPGQRDKFKEIEKTLPMSCKYIYSHVVRLMNELDTIYIEFEDAMFGRPKSIRLLREDILRFMEMREIGARQILVYMGHLYKYLKEKDKVDYFSFVDPGNIPTCPIGTDGRDLSQHIADQLEAVCRDSICLIPYNTGYHWILTIVNEDKNMIYLLDSTSNRNRDDTWKTIVTNGVKMYNASKGISRGPGFKILTGNLKQNGSVECGYCVMRYMKEIVDCDDPQLEKMFAGCIKKQYYNQSQYDEVRSEWSEFVYSYVGA